jgi:hypothetical protein
LLYRHFARRIDPAAQAAKLFLGSVKADGAKALAELDRERQPDVAQADDGNGGQNPFPKSAAWVTYHS